MDSKKHRDILNSFKPEVADGKVGVVIFEDNHIKVQVYSNKKIQREYSMKKKDFTYEVGLVVLNGVTRIVVFGDNTIEDAKIINLIADIKDIDHEDEEEICINMKSQNSDENTKKYMN